MAQSDERSASDGYLTDYAELEGELVPFYYGVPSRYDENGTPLVFSRRQNAYVPVQLTSLQLWQNVTASPTFEGNNTFQDNVSNQSFAGPIQRRQLSLQNPHHFSTNQGFSPNVPIQANVGDNSHFQPNVMMPPPFGGGHHFPGSIPLQPNVWPNQGYQQNLQVTQQPWNVPAGPEFQQNMCGTQFQWSIPNQSIAGQTQSPPLLVPMNVNPEEGNVLVGYIPVMVNSRPSANRGGYSRGRSRSYYRRRNDPRLSTHPATNRRHPVHHLDLRRNEESVVEVVNDSEEVVEAANNTPDTDKIADANCNVKPSEACLSQTDTSPLTMDSSDSSAEPTYVDTPQTPSITTCEQSLEVAVSSVKSDVNTEVGLQKLSISNSTVQSANGPPSSYKTYKENRQQLVDQITASPAATNVQPAEYGDKPTTSRRFVPRAAPKRIEKCRQQVDQGNRPQAPSQPQKIRVTPKPHEFQPVPKNKSFDLSKASEKSKLAMETARKQAQLEARLSQNEKACALNVESSSNQPCSSSQQATLSDVKLELKLSGFVTKAELNPPPAVPKVSKRKRRAAKKKQEKADSDLVDAAVFEEAARYNLAITEEADEAERNNLAASEEAARLSLEVKINEYLAYREKVSEDCLQTTPQTLGDLFADALLKEHFFGAPFQDEDIVRKNCFCEKFLALLQDPGPLANEDVESMKRFYKMILINNNPILVKDITTLQKLVSFARKCTHPVHEYMYLFYYYVAKTPKF